MVIRETTIEAWVKLVASGRLAKQQTEVAEAFVHHGPGTAAEVLRAARLDSNLNLKRARVGELRDRGVLEERGARKCNITGRRAIVFAFDPVGSVKLKPRQSIRVKTEDWKRLAVDAIKAWCDREAFDDLLGEQPFALQRMIQRRDDLLAFDK